MNSIVKEISPEAIVASIKLHRQNHRGAFILVEGSTDSNLYGKFILPQACLIIICYNKDMLKKVAKILYEEGFIEAIGIADSDFDDDESPLNIYHTDENDAELMIIATPAFREVLNEVASDEKLSKFETQCGLAIAEYLFVVASTIGALRILSRKHGWNLKFKGMEYQYASNSSSTINITKQISHLFGRSQCRVGCNPDNIVQQLEDIRGSKLPSIKCCNGSDVIAILGRALKKEIGTTNNFASESGQQILRQMLRLAFGMQHFSTTQLYKNLCRWEKQLTYDVFQK
jgi:hypothetical protein